MVPQWFTLYMLAFNKTYTADLHEAMRNVKLAKHHVDTHIPTSYTLALNPRSDMRHVHVPWRIPPSTARGRRLATVPSTFDWRNYVTFSPLVDQGKCNACFAIAAAGVLEYWAHKLHKTVSAQHIVDCTPHACDGGVVDGVFKWGGPYGVNAPYDGHPHACTKKGSLHVHDYTVLTDNVEASLAQALMHGPVAVGVDSASSHFQLYSGGVFTHGACNKQIDHAMLLVGYTPEYWILRNSYGTHWGEHGYMRLERHKNACGIGTYATYVDDAS